MMPWSLFQNYLWTKILKPLKRFYQLCGYCYPTTEVVGYQYITKIYILLEWNIALFKSTIIPVSFGVLKQTA